MMLRVHVLTTLLSTSRRPIVRVVEVCSRFVVVDPLHSSSVISDWHIPSP